MKPIFSVLFLLLVSSLFLSLSAQPGNLGISYQAALRDAAGEPMVNASVNVTFEILQGNSGGNSVFSETHSNTNTDSRGLVNLVIGSQNSSNWSNIDWGASDYFLKVSLNGALMGTQQLASVPFAKVATDMDLHHLKDVSSNSPDPNQVLKWNGNEWAPAADAGGSSYVAGSGISINGSTIENTAPDQTVSISGSGASSVSGSYPNFTISSTDQVNDADANPSNEIQTLSLNGSTLALSQNGGSVILPNSSAWNTIGSEIYYNAGNIGIGVTNPNYDLHLEGGSGNLVHIEHTATGSTFDLIEMQVDPAFTGQFLELQKGTSTVAQIHADGSANFKNVRVSDQLSNSQAPEKGRVYADGLPLAYGRINGANGNVLTDYGVLSCTRTLPGQYTVVLNNSWVGTPVIMITQEAANLSNNVVSVFPYPNDNKFEVDILGGDRSFHFVVYGNPQ